MSTDRLSSVAAPSFAFVGHEHAAHAFAAELALDGVSLREPARAARRVGQPQQRRGDTEVIGGQAGGGGDDPSRRREAGRLKV